MDQLNSMIAFVKVAELKGFTAAAQELGLSKGTVSKLVNALEDSLRSKLFNRTTRQISLTEAGEIYYEHCVRALAEVESAQQAVQKLRTEPRGRVRISVPVTFGQLHIAPVMPNFLRTYPEIQVDMVMTNRMIDLVEEGFDICLRMSAQTPQHLVAKKLAVVRWVLCASPGYLEQAGTPQHPDELTKHRCFTFQSSLEHSLWRFKGPDAESPVLEVHVKGNYQVNNVEALNTAVVQNLGISILPTYIAGPDLLSGRLKQILPNYTPQTQYGDAICAVFMPDRHLLPKVRVMVDFLARHFGPEPYWDKGVTLA